MPCNGGYCWPHLPTKDHYNVVIQNRFRTPLITDYFNKLFFNSILVTKRSEDAMMGIWKQQAEALKAIYYYIR